MMILINSHEVVIRMIWTISEKWSELLFLSRGGIREHLDIVMEKNAEGKSTLSAVEAHWAHIAQFCMTIFQLKTLFSALGAFQ